LCASNNNNLQRALGIYACVDNNHVLISLLRNHMAQKIQKEKAKVIAGELKWKWTCTLPVYWSKLPSAIIRISWESKINDDFVIHYYYYTIGFRLSWRSVSYLTDTWTCSKYMRHILVILYYKLPKACVQNLQKEIKKSQISTHYYYYQK